MQATDCRYSENSLKVRGAFGRRLLDTNGARPWLWTAVTLAAGWIVAVIYLPF